MALRSLEPGASAWRSKFCALTLRYAQRGYRPSGLPDCPGRSVTTVRAQIEDRRELEGRKVLLQGKKVGRRGQGKRPSSVKITPRDAG